MSLKPTRKEWMAACRRVLDTWGEAPFTSDEIIEAEEIIEAVLGPCPAEPAPEPWRIGEYTVVEARPGEEGTWWVSIPRNMLAPREAESMAEALIKHAAYAREMERETSVCGRVMKAPPRDRSPHQSPFCPRPKGHPGVCSPANSTPPR